VHEVVCTVCLISQSSLGFTLSRIPSLLQHRRIADDQNVIRLCRIPACVADVDSILLTGRCGIFHPDDDDVGFTCLPLLGTLSTVLHVPSLRRRIVPPQQASIQVLRSLGAQYTECCGAASSFLPCRGPTFDFGNRWG
jgi:hypothetical protein